MAVAKPQSPLSVTTTGVTAYQVTGALAAGSVGNVKELILENYGASAATVTVYMVPSGGGISASNMILNTVSMDPGDTVYLTFNSMLEPNAFVRLTASADNTIKVLVSALEFDAPTILKAQPPVLLSTTASIVYTVPSGRVGNPKEIIFCNTTGSPATITLYFVTPGMAVGDLYTIMKAAPLDGNQTLTLPFNSYLHAGATIQALASVTSAVSMRVSVAEYA